MAEPLSSVASIIAVTTLAAQVSKLTYNALHASEEVISLVRWAWKCQISSGTVKEGLSREVATRAATHSERSKTYPRWCCRNKIAFLGGPSGQACYPKFENLLTSNLMGEATQQDQRRAKCLARRHWTSVQHLSPPQWVNHATTELPGNWAKHKHGGDPEDTGSQPWRDCSSAPAIHGSSR